MEELTPEKWTELNDKLAAEREVLKAELGALAGRLTKISTIAVVLLFAGVGAMLVGSYLEFGNYVLFGAPLAFLLVIDVFFVLRVQRMMALKRSDIDRVDADIRAWKKRKPGSIFAQQRKAKADTPIDEQPSAAT